MKNIFRSPWLKTILDFLIKPSSIFHWVKNNYWTDLLTFIFNSDTGYWGWISFAVIREAWFKLIVECQRGTQFLNPAQWDLTNAIKFTVTIWIWIVFIIMNQSDIGSLMKSRPISEQTINLVTLNWLILTDLIDWYWYCSVGIVLFFTVLLDNI
jgi:hypothetical protein